MIVTGGGGGGDGGGGDSQCEEDSLSLPSWILSRRFFFVTPCDD